MKNIDLLAAACAPAADTTPTPATAPVVDANLIQQIAEKVVQILSQPAQMQADPEPKQEPAAAPEPEKIEEENDNGHNEPGEVG